MRTRRATHRSRMPRTRRAARPIRRTAAVDERPGRSASGARVRHPAGPRSCRRADPEGDTPVPDAANPARRTPDPQDGGRRRTAGPIGIRRPRPTPAGPRSCRRADPEGDTPIPDAANPARRTPDPQDGGRRRTAGPIGIRRPVRHPAGPRSCRRADPEGDTPIPDAANPARRTPDPQDGGRRRPAGQSSRGRVRTMMTISTTTSTSTPPPARRPMTRPDGAPPSEAGRIRPEPRSRRRRSRTPRCRIRPRCWRRCR